MPRKCKFDGEWEQALSLLNDADAAQARLRRQRIKADSTAGLQPVCKCAPEEAQPSTPPAQKADNPVQISQEMKHRKKAKHRKWSRNKHKKNLQMKELIHTFATSK